MSARLTDYKVLTFDCYGTLIDWESGIWDALQPLLMANGCDRITRDVGLSAFAEIESAQQSATPTMRYSELLTRVHATLAGRFDLASTETLDGEFGASVAHWPAFPDTADALRVLKRHFKLVILSNVDRAGFAASNRKLGVTFDAIYTAEDIGSYKPAARNFEYMLDRLGECGIGKHEILHVAESLFHDHRPANDFGLASCWIHRRHDQAGFGATMNPGAMPSYDFRFTGMAALAEAHRAALSGR